METILWALDLCAVAYLCLWALRADKAEAKENGSQPAPAPAPQRKPTQGSKNA